MRRWSLVLVVFAGWGLVWGVAGGSVGNARAAGKQTGTLVVRLVTDPTPSGVSWTYAGAGSPFQLGQPAGEETRSLQAGSYQLREAPTAPGQPDTLTALICRDPNGNTTTDIGAASASIGLDDSETVTCTFTHRALGRRSAAATLALARTYAPVLRLTGGEPYRPLRLEDYLGATSLHSGTPPRGPLLQPHPTLFSLPTTPGSAYLDVSGAEPNTNPATYPQIQARLQAATPRPSIYWHITRQPAAGRTAIEYWFLYLYNDFYDRHEADWEGITVFLQDTTPLGVSYSAHQGRRWSAWNTQTTTGTHPIVYVARGSHANYPKPGRYTIRVCWTLYGHHCTPTPRIDAATGTGPTLNPSGYDLHEFGGTPYTGNWGSGTYILGIGHTHDQVTDPRHRADYTNPFTILTR
jgi:hypothetical protein